MIKGLGCPAWSLFRRPGGSGLRDILVDRVALEARRSTALRTMSASLAFHLLGFPPRINPAAIVWPDLGSVLGVLDDNGDRWVDAAALDWARYAFVGRHRLPMETGYTDLEIEDLLVKANAHPVFDPDVVGTCLYRRADIAPILRR